MPAKSMHSYSTTLYAVLDEFEPRSAFEWGPGTSTQILSLYPSVKKLTSVEHEIIYYDMIERLSYGNLNLVYKPDMTEYVERLNEDYDLIFVDGRNRAACLRRARGKSNLVILHDAARYQYRGAVNEYNHVIWTDDGNTAVLTDDRLTYERLLNCLAPIQAEEPGPEMVELSKKAIEKGMVL